MVFHITNYMRETNVWMIRKMRYLLWGFVGFIPVYRTFYWDFLGRRTAWKDYYSSLDEDQKIAKAESERANWGFKPRYNPIYDFSIKARKHEAMTREDTIKDHPRLVTGHSREMRIGHANPGEIRNIVSIASEHNRQPGTFNYEYPQTFYSLYPEIEQETYITLGGSGA